MEGQNLEEKRQYTLFPNITQDIKMTILQLKLLGFSLKNIRLALPKLTGTTQLDIARTLKRSQALTTKVLAGERFNADVQDGIAVFFRVPKEIIFPPETVEIPVEKFNEKIREELKRHAA